tara:strand:+ start:987 stop:3029 length:2043 start_codon:yes stop_codon:yes gene_type:complete
MIKINYRPEIDGLRAIAVVSVILYHANLTIFNYPFLKGGFIGVDIFFVISGYLITSLIYKELLIYNKFSFRYFYERRIRRILPALLTVIFLSLPLGFIYLLPSSFTEYAQSLVSSIGFSSNFYFHIAGQRYAAENASFIPFLHTWSLSVEEQFYILFPIIFFVVFKYLKEYLHYLLILFFFLSLLLAEWCSKNFPSLSFYLLPTRGWELIAGSILAYFEILLGFRKSNKFLNLTMPFIGLCLIILSIFTFDDKILHPSKYTLIPIIGVCLIIWFYNKDDILCNFLSSKLFVGVGLISYSLYLWHYPIFAFFNISQINNTSLVYDIIKISIVIFISILTYFLIEKPARNKKYKFKYILIPIIFISLLTIFISLIIIYKDGFKNRVPELLLNDLGDFEKNNWNLLKNSEDVICHDNINGCVFNQESRRKVFLIGDSLMGSIMYDLTKKLINKNYSVTTKTIISCLYFPGFDRINIKTKKIEEKCNDEYFSKLHNFLMKQNNAIIIFAGMYPSQIDNTIFDNEEGGIAGIGMINHKYIAKGKYKNIRDSFKKSLESLSINNKIIITYPFPEAGWHIPRVLFNLIPKSMKNAKNYFLKEEDYITTSYKVFKNRNKSSFDLLDSIEGKNIIRVYPHKLFCDNKISERCLTHDDKNIFYSDQDHPSVKASEMINKLIIEKINKIEN